MVNHRESLKNLPEKQGFSGLGFVWLLGIVAVFWAVLFLAACIQPRFNYNRWDNFEYFTPAITQTHDLWLHGHIPYWNPYQHRGEPILALGQSGPFYSPYTLSLEMVRLLGIRPDKLILVIVILHITLAGIGWFLFMNALGVRFSLAALTAVGICFGGYITVVSTVWIFMLPVMAWLPWILWSIIKLLADDGGISAAIVLVLGLAAEAYIGSPQMLIYVWIFVFLFFLLFGLWVYWQPKRMLPLLILFLVAILLSCPGLLPAHNAIKFSERVESFGLETFLARSVEPSSLLGCLLPLFKVNNQFLPIRPDSTSIMAYQGGWMIPAIVAAIFCLIGKRKSSDMKKTNDRTLHSKAFAASLVLAVFFCLCALGRYGGIYRLTYGIPVWSSFRWPFKFFLLSQAAVGMTCGLALEICATALTNCSLSYRIAVCLAPLTIAFLLLLAKASSVCSSFVGVLCLVSGLAGMAIVGWIDRPAARTALLLSGIAGAVGLVAMAHNVGMKTYDGEPWGRVTPEVLGIDTNFRVLPVSPEKEWVNRDIDDMQQLGHFHAATGNGYYSATGTTAGLLPRWFTEYMPCDVVGVPPPQASMILLPSHLLRSFNVKYVLVAGDDAVMTSLVAKAGGYRAIRFLNKSVVYENQDALPRAYFAANAYPFSQKAFEEGMLFNKSPLRSAYIAGWNGPERLPEAKILSAEWEADSVKFNVDAPQGGLLIISMSYYPDWHAYVDKNAADVLLANSCLQAVKVPAGAETVALKYGSQSLRMGLGLMAAGCLLFLLWAARRTLSRIFIAKH